MNNELNNKIEHLVDLYFTNKLDKPTEEADSITIRHSLQNRISDYFSKNELNDILIKKGFKHRILNSQVCCFNISEKDINLLSISNSVLKIVKKKYNYPLKEIIKISKFKNIRNYKYSFKYLIKLHLKDELYKTQITELKIYKVLAKELGISQSLLSEYLNIFNVKEFPNIPEEKLNKLIQIFDISYKESLTDQIIE